MDRFWTNGGIALVTFSVLLLFYIVLLRATQGSKHRRVVVPVIMMPATLLVLGSLLWALRWMYWG